MPTCDEQGYRDFDVATVLGLQSSAGVPAPVVAKLQPAVAKILREPEMARRIKTLGIHMAENGTAAYARFMAETTSSAIPRWSNKFILQIKQ